MEYNAYFWIILLTLVFHFLLERISSWLTLRSLSSGLPEEFQDVCDPDKYENIQAYTRARIIAGTIESIWDLALLSGFWLAGGFRYLDYFSNSLFSHPVASGLLFIGILAGALQILQIPFSVYSTFVLDERFGMNRTTVRTFVMDRIKGLILSLVLGIPLLGALLAFFVYAGPWAWAMAWGFVVVVSLFLQYFAPNWLLPLFNRFWALPEGELREKLVNLAEKTGFPLTEIQVMDGSRRSSRSNAFFTGFGRRKRIVLFDTLLERHSTDEIVAITAHEIGHYRHRHILIGTFLAQLQTGILFGLLSVFLGQAALFAAFGIAFPSVHAGLVFFSLLFTPVQLLLSLAGNALSRHHERQADRYSVEATGNCDAMCDALKKLAVDNLSNLTPHPFTVFLHASHPPVLQRIRFMRRVAEDPSPDQRA